MTRYQQLCVQLGQQARTARRAHGKSQQDLADKMDVQRITISNLERGKHVSLRRVLQIADLLQIDIVDLIPSSKGLGKAPISTPDAPVVENQRDQEFLDQLFKSE